MNHYNWQNVAEGPLPIGEGSVLRRFVNGERVTVARLVFAAGSAVPTHRHENEQISVVLSGALEFTVEGAPVVVRAGEALHLAANELHGARALEETLVLDIFAPPRADWGPPGA